MILRSKLNEPHVHANAQISTYELDLKIIIR